ncbi:MAG TPA: hypothetical protein QGG47_06860 [Acidobacteriota bacterium]|nr:hypothetical protein [Acidobacteriota bacterium]
MVGFVNNATHPQDTGEIRVGLLKVKRNDDACANARYARPVRSLIDIFR